LSGLCIMEIATWATGSFATFTRVSQVRASGLVRPSHSPRTPIRRTAVAPLVVPRWLPRTQFDEWHLLESAVSTYLENLTEYLVACFRRRCVVQVQTTLSCTPARCQLREAGSVVACRELRYTAPVPRRAVRSSLPTASDWSRGLHSSTIQLNLSRF